MTDVLSLSTGADLRLRNADGGVAAVLANGGTAKAVPGTWSAMSEFLVAGLASRFTGIAFAEVRYRVKSWNELESCMADAEAAIELVDRETLLIGFSMGGAVSIGVAGDARVSGVLGLAPWIPDPLSLEGLRGKRLDVIHGSWDRHFPGIPGVSVRSSRHGFERARALGVDGTFTLIPRGLHGAALRSPSGSILRLPRASAWIELVAERLAGFQSAQPRGPGWNGS